MKKERNVKIHYEKCKYLFSVSQILVCAVVKKNDTLYVEVHESFHTVEMCIGFMLLCTVC